MIIGNSSISRSKAVQWLLLLYLSGDKKVNIKEIIRLQNTFLKYHQVCNAKSFINIVRAQYSFGNVMLVLTNIVLIDYKKEKTHEFNSYILPTAIRGF